MGRKKQKKSSKKDKKKKKDKTVSSLMYENETSYGELPPQVLNSDEYLKLSQAKTRWLFGEWNKLAEVDYHQVEKHPERDRLAALIASAHQQLNQHGKAREWAKQALSWGCPPKVAAKVLISSVHNTFGRIAALKRNDEEARKHFQEAIRVVELQDAEVMVHARSIRELTKLGLLPQAAAYIDKEQQTLERQRPVKQKALNSILRTELELLNHELSLAQQRQQLYRKDSELESLDFDDSKNWKKQLEKKSVSQLGQDLWVLEQTGYKRNGFFVEFGATDGVLLSNTYLLEKEFGWDGICAEPNPKFYKKLHQNRKCTVSNDCISGKSGEVVRFILANEYGGIAEFAQNGRYKNKVQAYEVENFVTEFETLSLNEFLLKYNAPRQIDYLSIDTEGSEFEILSNFPFKKWRIECITVEHNYESQREKIKRLLTEKGYEQIQCQWDDFYRLRKSLF